MEEFGPKEMDPPVNKRLPEHKIEVIIPWQIIKDDPPKDEE